LRQLYGVRFPYIYGYAQESLQPDPADLGATGWTNAYRTGDYIGRYLWKPNFDPRISLAEAQRAEVVIGPGAHTHYWDKTADRVAETLDAMIARA
jgi:hypothetical protein